MKNAAKFMKNFHYSKPDVILRSIPRNADISVFGDKYNNFLRTIPKINNIGEIQNHLNFPYILFNSFPKETLTKIINDSFEIIKSKVESTKHTYIYNKNMRNHMINEIDFDVKALLLEMNNSSVPFNKGTYQILIELNCKRGEMEAVENIIKAMVSEGIELDKKDKLHLITGYIISGQSDKVETIIKENNFDENNIDVLACQGRGYAVMGNSEKVISVLNKMKENNFELIPLIYTFYRLLAISNVSETDLEQISQMIPEDNPKDRISSLIFYLNRNGHYNKSLKFAEKYQSVLLDNNTIFDILTSFNSKLCPTNIYKSVLKLFCEHIDLSQRNLFSNMHFDEALAFSRSIVNEENGNVILTSLENKAISDKSVNSIKESLRFGIDNLRAKKLNLQLQFGFIPSILESGMVSNCEELLNLLPEFKNKILPCVLIHHLCKGNFSEFNHLMLYNKFRRPLAYNFGNYPMGTDVMRNVGLEELEMFASEASKVFNSITVNGILSSSIVELVVNQSKLKTMDCISKVVKLTQKFDLTFTESEIRRLKKNNPDNAQIFDSFRIRNENSKSKINESEIDQTDVD